ncbi:D-tyrosyl-tRNA(Tyr) deacylase [Kribbella orskensis]|uniref:D-aminoacyl-tRNA deacylase n=1 Tax=Kribbella orskensis TaxID=2512216 RepID=A0ABY2BNQ1_9ACTN|nr:MULTISPECIES: D-aminoacyl-tRNA deacylase [Kribbella]TCN40881.1 D-tyrosyl-tRNA(Tyr) deacylase [Kribbella sp. VKM Ac-2500]TCO24133.1 D-tyrosyl-tRNA(Tyr) deacylase [Kribbella orskensis]
MRAVLQRVKRASVVVEGDVVGAIDEPGLVVLVGVTHDDTAEKAAALASKIWTLRILRDERSCADEHAPILAISQFTLYADTRKGRRPSWSAAAPASVSEPLYEAFCAALESLGAKVERGRFGADMEVTLTNDGPVTLILDV